MYIAAGATFLIEWDASTAKTFGVWCAAFTWLDPRSLPQGTPKTSDSWLLSIAPQTAALPTPFLIPLMPVHCYFHFCSSTRPFHVSVPLFTTSRYQLTSGTLYGPSI